MSADFELAPGRVLHFNETSWDRLEAVLRAHHLDLMAEHVAEQRSKGVVVLDLSDDTLPADVVVQHLRTNGHRVCACIVLADQIEAQTKPPRIPEPGQLGVVEAHIVGETGPQAPYWWVRSVDGRWAAIGSSQPTRRWSDLIDPVLIREGVDA